MQNNSLAISFVLKAASISACFDVYRLPWTIYTMGVIIKYGNRMSNRFGRGVLELPNVGFAYVDRWNIYLQPQPEIRTSLTVLLRTFIILAFAITIPFLLGNSLVTLIILNVNKCLKNKYFEPFSKKS